jgi:putative transcriptional regulator
MVERLRSFVEALESGEDISKKFTVRRVEFKFGPHLFTPDIVKDTRRLLRASQAVFARFLGVSVQTVRAWEQGTNPPSDMACRFLDEIRLNPPYWQQRLKDSLRVKPKRKRAAQM